MRLWNYVMGIVRKSDIVIEVVDARCPDESRSLKLEKAVSSIGHKIIIILNKADLVPKEFAEKKAKDISKEHKCIYISSKDKKGVVRLKSILRSGSKNKKIKVAVIGHTNTGKSSIINALRGRKSAKVAPIPGYTTHGQWIKISENIMMWDTPGILPEDKISAIRGNVNPEKIKDIIDISRELLKTVIGSEMNNLKEVYKTEETKPRALIKDVARNRGFFLKKGELDIKRAAKTIIIDWNRGKLTACIDKDIKKKTKI